MVELKRILPLLLALALLAGCTQAGGQSQHSAVSETATVQDAIDPVNEAKTYEQEPSTQDASLGQSQAAAVQVDSEPEAWPEPEPEPWPEPEPVPEQHTDSVEAELTGEVSAEPDGTPLTDQPLKLEEAPAVDVAAFEQELLRLINEERGRNGLQALGLEDNMHWAARIRAAEVQESLSHTRPDGTPYYTVFDEAGFVYAGKWHGENVSSMSYSHGAYTTAEAAAEMFVQLHSSAGHMSNMLSENFHQVGIGVYVLDSGDQVQIASAQLFASL